jgi:uncharacterized membrane protein
MTSLTALPETVRGLPLHALVVHAVVVLVPLAALGGIVCAVWPAVRRHFGALTLLGAVVATALVPVATGSGENFERQLGAEDLVRNHQHWAERMLPAMGVLLVSLIALVVLDVLRRSAMAEQPVPAGVGARGTAEGAVETIDERPRRTPLTVVDRRIAAALPVGLRRAGTIDRLRLISAIVAVVVVLAALAALYVCLQTGESGARAVWGGR